MVKGSGFPEAILLDFGDMTAIKGVINMFLEAILLDFRDMTVFKGVVPNIKTCMHRVSLAKERGIHSEFAEQVVHHLLKAVNGTKQQRVLQDLSQHLQGTLWTH